MATFNPATSEIAILFYKVLLRMAQFPATLKKVSSACPKCPTSTPSNFKIVNTVERQMHWSAVGFRSSLARRSESALLEHASIADAAPTGAL